MLIFYSNKTLLIIIDIEIFLSFYIIDIGAQYLFNKIDIEPKYFYLIDIRTD